MNTELVKEFNNKIQELKRIAEELSKDFLEVKSSEESLAIEDVINSLEDAEKQIARAVELEKSQAIKAS